MSNQPGAVRRGYAHQATLGLEADADPAAPGGAVTVALCGSWEHDGRCTWPHHSDLSSTPDGSTLRTVFVAEPEQEHHVRALIEGCLRVGALTGPDERVSAWGVRASGPVPLSADEQRLVDHLTS